MGFIRSCGIVALSSLSLAAHAQELLGDPSFAQTASIDNLVPWTPQTVGVWGDPNDVHFAGVLVTGECRVDPCARIRSRPVSIPDGYNCATEAGDDKPGCKEGIRQGFAAVDSRSIVRVSFFARRGVEQPAGWNVAIGLIGGPSDVNVCGSLIVAPASTSYGEISLSRAELAQLSGDCFSTLGTHDVAGLVLTKLGVQPRDVFIDDVSVMIAPMPPSHLQVVGR